jgi:hypothetical protein
MDINDVPRIISCVGCGVFLGVITENGFMSGNTIMTTDDLPEKSKCAECGEDIWNSIVPS